MWTGGIFGAAVSGNKRKGCTCPKRWDKSLLGLIGGEQKSMWGEGRAQQIDLDLWSIHPMPIRGPLHLEKLRIGRNIENKWGDPLTIWKENVKTYKAYADL